MNRLRRGQAPCIDGLSEEEFLELPADNDWMKPGPDRDYQVRYVFPEEDRITRLIEEMTPEGRGMERSVTAQYDGDRRDDLTYLEIDIAEMPVGVHKLMVTVKDVRTEQIAERDVLFRVVE